jgi:hypothetical protein
MSSTNSLARKIRISKRKICEHGMKDGQIRDLYKPHAASAIVSMNDALARDRGNTRRIATTTTQTMMHLGNHFVLVH